jgi:zinc transporter 1/2/3
MLIPLRFSLLSQNNRKYYINMPIVTTDLGNPFLVRWFADGILKVRGIIVDLFYYKIMAGILIFLTTVIVVIYPIKTRTYPKHNRTLELADAFASGIFLGAGLFHMLPDAINNFASVYPENNYPIAELFCAGGFLLLLFLERVSNYFAAAKNHVHTLSYMLASILIIHALIEGAVLGVNNTFATASVIFLAIIAHKSSESFALAVIMNRSDLAIRRIVAIIILFSLMTPLGIAFGTSLMTILQSKESQLFTAGFNAFAAGTFLYMSTLHHINHHQRQHEAESLLEFVALLVGLIIMGVLSIWA